MTVSPSTSDSSRSLKNHLDDFFVSMPTSPNASPQSNYELQTFDTSNGEEQTPATWRSLFAFTNRQHAPYVVLAVISSIAAGIPQPTSAIFYGYIFSNLAKFGGGTLDGQETLRNISIWCIALTALGVVSWVVQGGALSAWMVFGEFQAKTVRKTMFEGMLDKDMEWYDLRKDGISSLLIRIHT